jgi:serine/threonine protein kinase
MGEVYKGRDTRLDRTVAIKVLPPDRGDARRFEQEARAVAALNHPNIVSIYDVGENYIVTELVDGATLRNQSFSLRKTLDIVVQVAEGLAAAHAAGFAHRDLKPDNIMVTRDGRAKILDFGLAKPLAGLAEADSTRTMDGFVIGTVGYMSPEQVRGNAACYRSDIFSLGAVLYEMLTGTRAFQADTVAEVMTAILKEDPPEPPATVPAGVREVVRHCLEKDPAQRFQSAKDLAFALATLNCTEVNQSVAAPLSGRRWQRGWLIAACACALAGALMSGILLADRPFVDVSHVRFTPMVAENPLCTNPAWSSQGRSFAFVGGQFGYQTLLMTKSLDSPIATQAATPMNTMGPPVFSKDGARLYYTASSDGLHRELWTVALAGGNPEKVLADLGGFVSLDGLAVTPDGSALVLTLVEGKKIVLATSSPPGPPLQRSHLGFEGVGSRTWLRFSHDGKQLLAINTGNRSTKFWLSSWPPVESARQIFPQIHSSDTLTNADWMPGGRYVLMTLWEDFTSYHSSLCFGDTYTSKVYPITLGP